ncbi:transcriptional regulator, TetR family [Streptomyces sp. WMMB 714]|uniref:TetR/AcrR family transcriptional regulator n=1 Tax=Streptomyces sp. WMMB 714 TaxID=1286822 RepID=UPI0005F7FD78|nr:TetR/AcrR family transcriptional regulator [Streptomyces sp. WMMB 714]SCK23283.1 transcriptional regulator, TetR family [Streptomyces sp. WMMB 714]
MRRDAQRNREAVLAAAREVYAEQGVEAPLDVIARRAGVGNATLYRRFPDRASLIEAVFHDMLTATVGAGEEARRAEDPWNGLVSYVEHLFAGLAADRGATDLLTTGVEGVPTLDALHAHNAETFRGLLARCVTEGTARDDLSVEDLLFALAVVGRAVPAAEAASPGSWRRLLALFVDGLRREGASPLPAEPLTGDQLAGALRELHGGQRGRQTGSGAGGAGRG